MSRFFVPDLGRDRYLGMFQGGQTDLAIAQIEAQAKERRRREFTDALESATRPIGQALMMRAQQRAALDQQYRAKYGMGLKEIEQTAAAKGIQVRDVLADLDDSLWERDMTRRTAGKQIEYDLSQKNELERIRREISEIEKARVSGELSPEEYAAAMRYKRGQKYGVPFKPAPPPSEPRFHTDETGRRWIAVPSANGEKWEPADDKKGGEDKSLQSDIDAAMKELEQRSAETGMDYDPAEVQRLVGERRAMREAIKSGKPIPVRPLSGDEAADFVEQKRIVAYYTRPGFKFSDKPQEAMQQREELRRAREKSAHYQSRMQMMQTGPTAPPPTATQPSAAPPAPPPAAPAPEPDLNEDEFLQALDQDYLNSLTAPTSQPSPASGIAPGEYDEVKKTNPELGKLLSGDMSAAEQMRAIYEEYEDDWTRMEPDVVAYYKYLKRLQAAGG